MPRPIRQDLDSNLLSRDFYEFLSKFNTRNIDLKGRRIINAGNSKDLGDYITRAELYKANQNLETIVNDLQAELRFLKRRVSILEDV